MDKVTINDMIRGSVGVLVLQLANLVYGEDLEAQ